MTDEPLGELDRVTREQIENDLDAAGVRDLTGELSDSERRLLRHEARLRAAGKPPMSAESIPHTVQPAVRKILLRE